MTILGSEIVAQGIGIIAMAFNILAYQGKKQSTVIVCQLVGSLLFALNFFMLGAVIGGILNAISAVRAVIFLNKDKLKAEKNIWLYGFIVVYIVVYVLNFTVFSKEITALNMIVEFLPVVGMTALSVGYRMKKASDVRKMGLISSPAWLIYNIVVGSYGAIICETLTIISIFLGIFRHDKRKK